MVIRSQSLILLLSGFCFMVLSCKTDRKVDVDETVYIQLDQDPERLNPLLYPLSHARPVNQNIFLPLAEYDPFTLEYKPLLIKAIPQKIDLGDEGYRYDMEIVDQAEWEDGKPVTAHDYLFTLKLVLHPLTAAKSTRTYLDNISNVEVDSSNDRKFSVYFKEQYGLALESATNFDILPAHIYDSEGYLSEIDMNNLRNEAWFNEKIASDSSLIRFADDINSQKYSREVVVGCGPYKLVDWRPEEVVVLEKKENYWGKDIDNPAFNQNVGRIIFKIIPDEVSAIAQLKTGLLDLLPQVSAESYTALKADSLGGNFAFYENYLMQYYFLVLNNQHPVLQDKFARKALSHCTNTQEYIDLFEKGFAQPTVSFVNPAKKEYNRNLQPIAYDIGKAKSLLKEGGWEDTNGNGIVDNVVDGRKVEFEVEYFASGKLGSEIGLLLKEDAAKAGMDIEIIKKSYALIKKENLETGDFGMTSSRLTQSVAMDDPYLRFHSDNAGLGGTNYPMYKNAQVDSLIEVINKSTDDKTLKVAFDELQAIIFDDQPLIYLYVPKAKFIGSKKWDIKTSIKRPGYFPNTFEYVGVKAK